MLLIKYILFAVIATAVNLSTQYPFFKWFSGHWVLYVAMMVGTLTGLVTKYLLDKRWIFYYTPSSKADNISKFGLYSLVGVFTTIIFWGSEILFYHLFTFPNAQLWGGAFGLSIGYICKYVLDKKFVFSKKTA